MMYESITMCFEAASGVEQGPGLLQTAETSVCLKTLLIRHTSHL